MSFDLIALWTGRILIILLAWLIIFGIFYGTFNYMFRYFPAFRFAAFTWATQKAGKGEYKEITLYKSKKTYQFKELIDK